jgi:hypothetical protein
MDAIKTFCESRDILSFRNIPENEREILYSLAKQAYDKNIGDKITEETIITFWEILNNKSSLVQFVEDETRNNDDQEVNEEIVQEINEEVNEEEEIDQEIMKRRLVEKNKIYNEINTLNVYIERNNRTIENYKGKKDLFYARKRVDLSGANENYKDEIQDLRNKLDQIDRGVYDKRINEEYKQSVLKIKRAGKRKGHAPIDGIVKPNFRLNMKNQTKRNGASTVVNKTKRGEVKEIKKFKYELNEKNYEKGLQHYNRAWEKLGQQYKDKLKKMPNNKGYKFNDVIFYGELPSILGEKTKIEILGRVGIDYEQGKKFIFY